MTKSHLGTNPLENHKSVPHQNEGKTFKQYSYKPTSRFRITMGPSVIRKNGTLVQFFTGFIRIKGVINWFAISFLGFLSGMTSLVFPSYITPLLFFAISTFFILAFTFAINNYYDIDTDKENPRRAALNALASGTISKRAGMIYLLLFILIPLVVSLVYSWMVFVFCSLLIVWMWMYSAPPLRLKSRPGVDILWHFIVFFALVLWGSYLAGSVSLISILLAVSLGVFGCFAQIDNHIHDYQFDKASGSTTFAVWIGLPNSKRALVLTFLIYIVFLIPLIIFFSFNTFLTILVVGGGIVGSFILVKTKKSTGASSLYNIINVFGKAVYLNCLIYHLSSIL